MPRPGEEGQKLENMAQGGMCDPSLTSLPHFINKLHLRQQVIIAEKSTIQSNRSGGIVDSSRDAGTLIKNYALQGLRGRER